MTTVSETWSTEELPVLRAIRQAELESKVNCPVDALVGREGVDKASLPLILDRLHRDGFIVANRISSPLVSCLASTCPRLSFPKIDRSR